MIAPDHPGDTLGDWLLGAAVDDATNEMQRVDDVRFVIDAALGNRPGLDLIPDVDASRIVAGHSYGVETPPSRSRVPSRPTRACGASRDWSRSRERSRAACSGASTSPR